MHPTSKARLFQLARIKRPRRSNFLSNKMFTPRKTVFFAYLFVFMGLILASSASAAVPKEEVLKKYEQVIVRSNQMIIYGYDLSDVRYKLKQATDSIVGNRYEEANGMLDEIRNDLRVIGARGPEQFRQEKKLAWIEVFGDFIQQFAIFVVLSLVAIRFKFVKDSISRFKTDSLTILKLAGLFSVIAILGATVGFIRYGQSSWAFVDLQVIFVGVSGVIGGFWVGLLAGILNGLFRLFMVPNAMIYSLIPLSVGLGAGSFRSLREKHYLRDGSILLIGLIVGLIHSLFIYVPIFRYISPASFIGSMVLLGFAEALLVYLFFVIAWQIFKEEKAKETERELMRAQIQFLQAQINPHFLFNALNTIAAVCGEESAKRTRDLIMQLSTFFRRITKRESDFVSLKDELEYIDAYLKIESARFGSRLEIERNYQLSKEGSETPVPALILQPIVENAIKHGISRKTEGGKLILSVKEEDSRILVEIKDTGVGMTEENKENLFKTRHTDNGKNEEHAGVGFSNIRNRLVRCYGNKSKIAVESVPNQGTTVTVELPKKIENIHLT